jgi:predicted Rdx family selenoprotein
VAFFNRIDAILVSCLVAPQVKQDNVEQVRWLRNCWVAQPLYIGFSNSLFSDCSHLIPGEGLLHYGGLTGHTIGC